MAFRKDENEGPSSVDQMRRMAQGENASPALVPDLVDEVRQLTGQGKGKGRRNKVLFTLGKDSPAIAKKEESSLKTGVLVKSEADGLRGLSKSLYEALDENGPGLNRISFDKNPAEVAYQVVYQAKPRGIPEWLLKRLAHQDDLVAAIVRTRAHQLRTFGVPRPGRDQCGFEIVPKEGLVDKLDDAAKKKLDERIHRARDLLMTCGDEAGVKPNEKCSFADFLYLSTQSALVVGKVAVEKIRDQEGKVHSFRAVDAGTIFPATVMQTAGRSIRKQAMALLSRLKNEPESVLAQQLNLRDWKDDKYSWVQVIETTPKQVFTDDQLLVKMFYGVPDVEMMGHPITPLDTVISAVMTHINITTHTRVYFQSGRAAKGMLVVKSDDADNDLLEFMQEHFQANINSAANAWRLPCFAIGPNDEIVWQPIDQQGSRDSEFQYLTDAVARIIMTAFQMSPDELPGWSYLSKGTSAQTLSESSSEYRLEAHRDLGIRPLIAHFEEMINDDIFPIIDADLAKICRVQLFGLDAESKEKESQRLAEDSPIHMTMNQILEVVEKEPLPAHLGGDVLLNPQFHQLVLDKFVTVGWIREKLLGIPGASKDPRFDYVNSPSFFTQQQIIQAAQQAAAAQQQAQEQAAQQQQAQANTGPDGRPAAKEASSPGVGDDQPRAPEGQGQGQPEQKAEDLRSGVREALAALGKGEDDVLTLDLDKSEKHLSASQRRILRHHQRLVDEAKRGYAEDARTALDDILTSVDELVGKSRTKGKG